MAAYWRTTYLLFSDVTELSIYYSLLSRLAKTFKLTRQFVEVLIMRAFDNVCYMYDSLTNTMIIYVDKVLELSYKELSRLMSRWAHRRRDFEDFWETRTIYAGGLLED